MATFCIIDIDTTIANNDHRDPLLVRGEDGEFTQESWNAFMHPDAVVLDAPQEHALHVLNHMRAMDFTVVFLTGRNESHRAVTDLWLVRHMGKTPLEDLVMRPAEKFDVPATTCKESMFLAWVETNLGPENDASFLFFEDNKHVLQVWKKYGLVFQCPVAWVSLNPEVPAEQERAWTR